MDWIDGWTVHIACLLGVLGTAAVVPFLWELVRQDCGVSWVFA